MKKNEMLTFIILAVNFLVTGFIVERQGILANDFVFVPFAILVAFSLTKYVFRVSKGMGKGGRK